MSKEGSSHLIQITWLHSHSNNHRLRKAAKKTPSSMDHDLTKKRVHRAILQSQQMIGLKDKLPQHPHHKLEDHHRLPQPPIQTETTRIHRNAITPMDPPKHLQTAKAQVLPNQRKASTNTDPTTQPSNTIICSQCGESGHWEQKLSHIIIFVIFVGCPHTELICVEPPNVDPDH